MIPVSTRTHKARKAYPCGAGDPFCTIRAGDTYVWATVNRKSVKTCVTHWREDHPDERQPDRNRARARHVIPQLVERRPELRDLPVVAILDEAVRCSA